MNEAEKINSLNGIRGFAVLLVLLSHASNTGLNIHPDLSFSGAGRYGVFLFFVLSAFLLTRQFIIAKSHKKDMQKFIAHYFLRRFLRIFPLFISALFLYYFLYKLGYGIYDVDGITLIKTLFLMDGPGIFWTIPVEFQYYFLLPVVALLLLYARLGVLYIVIGALLFSISWWYVLPPRYVPNLLPFFPIFLLGSVSAYISLKVKDTFLRKFYSIKINNILAGICVFLFFALTPGFYNDLLGANVERTAFHEEFLLFSLLSCCLVLFTIHSNGVVKKIMESRFFVFWGNISFSAYLGHMIILMLAVPLLGKPYSIEVKWLLFFVLTAAFSYISFKYLEVPLSKHQTFKRLYSKFNTKPVVTKNRVENEI